MKDAKQSKVVKDHRGRWDRDTVLRAMSFTRLNDINKKMVLEYLCDGKGFSEFACHRQQVHSRVKKVVEILLKRGGYDK